MPSPRVADTTCEAEAARNSTRAAGRVGGSPVAYDNLPDERLARSVASAEERPFQALYERYHQPLYRYCHSIVRNEADAHDALQSTFMRAFMALREGRKSAPLRPWLYRIAHNEAISIVRSRAVAERRLRQQEPPPCAPSADERADARARLSALLADLAELPQRARGALVMRELGGLSHEEIAAALGLSTGAAKQAIFEARTALVELTEGREMRCDDVRRRLSDGDARMLRGRRLRSHLSDCAGCAAFAAAIATRRSDLRALSPILAPAAAVSLLVRVLEHDHAGLSAAAGGSSATGMNGLAGGAGGAGLSAKALALTVGPKGLLALAAAIAAGGLALALPHWNTHGGHASGRAHSAGVDAGGATGRKAISAIRRGARPGVSRDSGGARSAPRSTPRHNQRGVPNSPAKHAARRGCSGCGLPPKARGHAYGHSRGHAYGHSGNRGQGSGQRSGAGPGGVRNHGSHGHSHGARPHPSPHSRGAGGSRASSR